MLLVATSCALLEFDADIVSTNDPNIIGYVSGSIRYRYNSSNTYDLANQYSIGWVLASSATPIVEILTNVPIPNTAPIQYQTIRYLKCASSCDATTWSQPYPILDRTSPLYTGPLGDTLNGQSVDKYTRAGVNGTENIESLWYTPGGVLLQARFGTGKVWSFNNVVTRAQSSVFFNATGCPAPTCTVIADIILVFDESGSIGNTSFQYALQFGVNIANSYTWAVGGVDGIRMAFVLFSTSQYTRFNFTNDQAWAVSRIRTTRYGGGYTCITCGINAATAMFAARTTRQTVPALVFLMTDGENNRQTGILFNNSIDSSKAAGITTIGIGVGSGVNSAELKLLSSSIPGLKTLYAVNDYASLLNIKDQLVGLTCTSFTGNPCGPSCKGFCSCDQTCLCPACDTTNLCTVPSCDVAQGSRCVYPPKNCDDGNACTTDSCNPSTGCTRTNVTCNDNNFCTDDSCSPAVGCQFRQKTCAQGADPCQIAYCNNSVGCATIVDANCDRCKIPNTQNARPCPDPNATNPAERPDSPVNLCKVWSCNSSETYLSSEYGAPALFGTCQFRMKNCDDSNNCTVDTCNPDTGFCEYTPKNCVDSDTCTDDSCDRVLGCLNIRWNASRCNSNDVCKNDTLNSSLPGCCQSRDISADLCAGAISDDVCQRFRCDYSLGCLYIPRDCEAEIGLDVLGQCNVATCTPRGAGRGCGQELIPDKQIDKCTRCDGQLVDSTCSISLTVSEAAGIGAGILAAIIIAIVVICLICGLVGGKVGLDALKKYRGKMAMATANPLYEEQAKGRDNPFYEEDHPMGK